MNKVVVINATLRESVHEVIDSSFIICLSQIFENVSVHFRKSRSNCVEKNITAPNVLYKPIKDSSTLGLKHQFFSAIVEAWIFLRYVKRDDICFVTYTNAYSSHLLNFLSKITRKKLFICCHSELRVVAEQSVSIKKVWRYSLKKFFTRTKFAKNVRFLVLGDSILQNLSLYLNEKRLAHFKAFDHPYFSNADSFSNKKDDGLIRIGVIGYLSAAKERGFDNVLKFARSIEDSSRLKLVIVSRISPDLMTLLPKSVEICSKDGTFLPREVYNKYLDELDYIYAPYPEDAFRFTASGALLEAIFRNKPVLFHGNDFALYLEKKFGTFGVCIDRENFACLSSILGDRASYEVLVASQKKFQNAISPKALSENLKHLLDV